MSNKKSERELLLEHFDANTPALVVHGTGASPDWLCVALLGDLTESLIPQQRMNNNAPTDAAIGLVVAAPVGMNLPGRLIDIVKIIPGATSLADLGLAAFARARTGVARDATDAADEQRHLELISQLVFRRGN